MLKLLLSQTNKIKQLDQLIRLQCTGTPELLARRLKISKRHVRNYISLLEDLGAEIIYCRHKDSYIYKYKYKLNADISIVELDNANQVKHNGGCIMFTKYKSIITQPFYKLSYGEYC